MDHTRPSSDRRSRRGRLPRIRLRTLPGSAVIVGLLLAGGVLLTGCGNDSTPSTADPQVVGLNPASGPGPESAPPWPAPADPRALAAAAGLPMGPMGMAEHYHPRLQIVVDGKPIEIPANLGVDPQTGQMSAVHTHTPDGVIHVEAAQAGQTFTLGQLFAEWNVKLGPGQIGALKSTGGTLTVTVNGGRWTGNPALLLLAPDQRIRLDYATR
jgi:hypothetical protein